MKEIFDLFANFALIFFNTEYGRISILFALLSGFSVYVGIGNYQSFVLRRLNAVATAFFLILSALMSMNSQIDLGHKRVIPVGDISGFAINAGTMIVTLLPLLVTIGIHVRRVWVRMGNVA